MRLSQLLIILILFSAMVTGLYNFYFSIADEYGVEYNKEFEEKYNKLDTISSKVDETTNSTMSIVAEKGDLRFLSSIWDVWDKTNTLIKAIYTIPRDIIKDIVKDMGMPNWVNTAIWGITIVLILTALLSILARRDW